MDDVDRKLMLLIFDNPRIEIREIAKKTGLSRQAVNLRMQTLARVGVFRNMTASITWEYLGATTVVIWGMSKIESAETTLDRLGESELTRKVIIAGGNYCYVFGFLRDVSELDDYLEFVRNAAEMPEPTAGIISYHAGIHPESYDGGRLREDCREFSPFDLKIIVSLMDNARKPISEIADEVGTSAKTVRRHLDSMMSDGKMAFFQAWDLTSGQEMLTILHLRLRDGADKKAVGRRLISIDPLKVVLIRSFTNLPDFLLGLISSDRTHEAREIIRRIREDEDVLSVTPNVLYIERFFDCWGVKLPAILARLSEKTLEPEMPSKPKS